MMWKKLLMPYV